MLYYLLFAILRIIALLPLKILYIKSDVLYLIVYNFARYRRKVVRTNLLRSFPEKPLKDIIETEKKFYRHFCDLIFETVKMIDFNHRSFMKRLKVINFEVIEKLAASRKSFIMISGHMGNWEWVSPLPRLFPMVSFYPIYHPLNSKAFDKYMVMLRSRFMGKPLPMKDTLKTVVNNLRNHELFSIWFIADQTPPKEGAYWTSFLNQDTPVFNGPAKIACKFNLPVIFLNMVKTSRGHYQIEFTLLEENPKNLTEDTLSEMHVKFLENIIIQYPEQWLWSHRRWKHKRMSN